MSLVQSLRSEILTPDVKLSVVMRRASVLAHRLKNDPMRNWVRREQDGYSGQVDALPPYRSAKTNSYGDILTPFQKGTNIPIPTIYIPDFLREEMGQLKVISGIRSLECHLESEQEAIKLAWPSDLMLLVSGERYGGGLYAAYRWLPRDMVAQVIDTVRNRLLDFTLELEDQYPDIAGSDEALSEVPVDASRQVFYFTFYGSNSRVNLGSIDHSANSAN